MGEGSIVARWDDLITQKGISSAGGQSRSRDGSPDPRRVDIDCIRCLSVQERRDCRVQRWNGAMSKLDVYYNVIRPVVNVSKYEFWLRAKPNIISASSMSSVYYAKFRSRYHIHRTPGMTFCSFDPNSFSPQSPTFLPPSFLFTRHHRPTSLSQMNCQITQVQLL